MPRLLITVILAIACTLLAAALAHRDAAPSQPIASERARSIFEPSSAEQDALLDRPVKAVSLDNVTLQEALDALAALTKVNVVINWNDLEGAGIDRNNAKHLTLHLRNVTLRQALDSLLHHGNAGGPGASLGYNVENGIVVVTTAESVSKVILTELIDLRPLLDDIGRKRTKWWFDHDLPHARRDIIDDIMSCILERVDPVGWRNSDAAIREIGGLLIVTQTPSNMTSIRLLLDQLHAAVLSGIPLPTTQPATQPSAN